MRKPKDRNPLLLECERLELAYITAGANATKQMRDEYFEADRKCRELGLLPETQSE